MMRRLTLKVVSLDQSVIVNYRPGTLSLWRQYSPHAGNVCCSVTWLQQVTPGLSTDINCLVTFSVSRSEK